MSTYFRENWNLMTKPRQHRITRKLHKLTSISETTENLSLLKFSKN